LNPLKWKHPHPASPAIELIAQHFWSAYVWRHHGNPPLQNVWHVIDGAAGGFLGAGRGRGGGQAQDGAGGAQQGRQQQQAAASGQQQRAASSKQRKRNP
jgi:hypothetical protein